MRPLTVLKVIDAWKWFAEAEQMFQASLALAERGHRVEVACQPESPAAARAREAGLVVHPLPGLRGPRSPLTPLRNVARLARTVEAVAPDVVHAYRSPPHVLAALALRRVRGTRPALVRTRAGAQPITRNALNRRLYDRWTALTLVTSDRIRDDMIAGGFDGARLRAVPAVVDPGRLAGADGAAFRRALGVKPEVPLIGIVGRLAPVKGHRHFLAALARLRKTHPDALGCIVGPPAELSVEEVRARAEAEGVDDGVRVLGARDDVASALAAFDVVAICSVGSEVISRVLLEAMWLGRPIVATRVGIIPETVTDRETALLVEPVDAAAAAEGFAALLDDPALAAELGHRAAAQARAAHRPERLAEALEAAYAYAAGR